MSCYHPLTAISLGQNPETGKSIIQFIDLQDRKYRDDILYLPCGRCLGCRLDYSRRWADRMMLELDSWNGRAIFLTLTYDDRHLVNKDGNLLNECRCDDKPCDDKCKYKEFCVRKDGSLYKRHLQLFMKRIRKEMYQEKYGFLKLRFYACGEYGDWSNTHRPHYHIILYGLDFEKIPDKKLVHVNELRQESYTSPFIAKFWEHGNISFSEVSYKTCAYVSRYVTKKVLDPTNDLTLEKCNLNPLFTLMSRKPGIGGFYLEEHPECLDVVKFPISTETGKREVYLPRYFINRIELTDPVKHDKILAERSLMAKDSIMSKLAGQDLEFLDYLENEERKVYKAISTLKRHKKGVKSLY